VVHFPDKERMGTAPEDSAPRMKATSASSSDIVMNVGRGWAPVPALASMASSHAHTRGSGVKGASTGTAWNSASLRRDTPARPRVRRRRTHIRHPPSTALPLVEGCGGEAVRARLTRGSNGNNGCITSAEVVSLVAVGVWRSALGRLLCMSGWLCRSTLALGSTPGGCRHAAWRARCTPQKDNRVRHTSKKVTRRRVLTGGRQRAGAVRWLDRACPPL